MILGMINMDIMVSGKKTTIEYHDVEVRAIEALNMIQESMLKNLGIDESAYIGNDGYLYVTDYDDFDYHNDKYGVKVISEDPPERVVNLLKAFKVIRANL